MTLRNDIHTAIDQIAPPAPALAGRVVASLRPAGKSFRSMPRGRRNPWLAGLGRTASLVAAILVVLLVVTLVVGVRLWRDRNAFNPSPAAPTVEAEVERLQARPLILPFVAPGGTCPASNTITYFGANANDVKRGLVFTVTGQGVQATSPWGEYYDASYYSDGKVKGIVLIRIRDLKTGKAGVFVGPYAAGDVVGTDTIDGKVVEQHAFAVLDLSHPPADANAYWGIRQGWNTGWSGCVGFQLDGPDFSQVIAPN
ncbi:MAG: hypothetical protein NVS1B3_11960 [Candidatus Dormibacteraceae bacterium]